MDIFTLAAAGAVISWPVFLIVLIVYYEHRRAKRIAQNLPLEDVEPQGFEVQINKPD